MARDIYFRTAFSGYNKNDVINFIEKLNEEQIERVNELNDRLRSSQTEAKKLSSELDDIKTKYDALEEKLQNLNSEIRINDEKASKYDTMQSTYADIMLEAESTAKDKIKTAEENARAIIAQANESKKKVLDASKAVVEDAQTEFTALVARMLENFDNAMTESNNE